MANEKKWDYQPELIKNAISGEISKEAVEYAELFGTYLGQDEGPTTRDGKGVSSFRLTTSQIRRFFGEVKRQQMTGYNESSFALLKPQLAYAVGRAKQRNRNKHNKIEDLYTVLSKAIDVVLSKETTDKQKAFKNFINFFEAIVAYHKANEN